MSTSVFQFLKTVYPVLMLSPRHYGYVPFAVLDPTSTGRQTREGSRTLEVGSFTRYHGPHLPTYLQYAFEDFGIRQVAQLLQKHHDVDIYTNRSLVGVLLHMQC